MSEPKAKISKAKTDDAADACGCMSQVNEQLAASNAALDRHLMMNFKERKASMSPPSIQLRKVDSNKKTKLPTLLAAHCPFCGKKYKS